MSDIQIFIKDKDNEGEWKDIDEGLLDLSSHDAKVRADGYNKAIDDFKKMLTIEKIKKYAESDGFINLNNCSLMIFDIAEQLKECD